MKIIINKFLVLENIQKSNENIEAAYKLYKSRPKYHHVSAKKKLQFSEHARFVQNNPYGKWFIIKLNNNPVGTIYFTFENNIGFFILDKYLKYTKKIFNGIFAKVKPLPKKLSINQDKFTINISSNNKRYQKIINDIGGKIIQKTFIFKKK